MNLTEKLIKSHLSSGEMIVSKPIYINIDQTLTQDVTGVMSYNSFLEMNVENVKTKSISYIDHNLLCTDYRTSDDHLFLESVAKKYGIYFSKAGNGICHSLHLSRFTKVGDTLIGTDSHTPMAGAVGMFSIGSGGVDVALAMAGKSIRINMPEVININLTGTLRSGVNAKDISLYMLSKFSVKGGVNKVFEYSGEGIKSLSIFERGTIANLGTEMGATTSIFPTDEITYKFFKAQKRLGDFKYINADKDAKYSEIINIDLNKIKPMVALPHSPDNVKKIEEIKNLKIDQIFIGSCTNSSYTDIKKVWQILKDKKINKNLSLHIAVGTKTIYMQLLEEGIVFDLIKSGARFTESACGACNGIGLSPKSGGISLRTTNRNFKGRSGTIDAKVCLVSPETAAVSAIYGYLKSPEEYDEIYKLENIKEPENYLIDDSEIIKPLLKEDRDKIKIYRTENIQKLPLNKKINDSYKLNLSIKLGDNISTDDISPTSANLSALRSNISELSKYSFMRIDDEFYNRSKELGESIILAGENYGQGSSREHAAINIMYLGVKIVLVKSIARIHKNNLINHGVIPMIFKNPEDYNLINMNTKIEIKNILNSMEANLGKIKLLDSGKEIYIKFDLNSDEIEILKSGGLINYIKRMD